MPDFKSFLGIELNAVSYREKAISGLGGFTAILLLLVVTESTLHLSGAVAVIASMGASAVLLFAVPHGSLSQPWPVIAGHGFSALIGVTAARCIPHHFTAAAAAVGFAILAMHIFKCIHPPGGATALTAVLGGSGVRDLGYDFVLMPVLVNAVVMVGVAILFNSLFDWRRYPAALNRPAPADPRLQPGSQPTHAEIVRSMQKLDSFVDITEDDLVRLVQMLRAERAARPVLSSTHNDEIISSQR